MQYRVGNLTIDTETHRTHVGTQDARLSKREQRLVEVLAAFRGRPVGENKIRAAMFGHEPTLPTLKIVDVYVCKARKKLTTLNAGIDYIETHELRGYSIRNAFA